jgi:hypothetical protein
MSRKRLLVGSVVLLLVIGAICYLWLKPAPLTSGASTQATQASVKTLPDGRPAPVDPDAAKRGVKEDFGPDTNAILAFAAAMMKPFELIGKVVDQNGEPVPGATIDWGANNNPDPYASGTRGSTTTDATGMFSVRSHGLDVYAKASKEGYATFFSDNRKKIRGSDGGFKNGGFLGNTDLPMGTKDAPAILVLRKMGETVALINAENFVRVPRNGSPVGIKLENAQAASNGDITVEAWTNDETKNEAGHYDWRCRISVPNGGLVERKDQSAFEAPAGGYKPFGEINMPRTAECWKPQESREYFVKLADGRYARIRFEMVAGGDNFVSITSYLNPTPGSRNLEYDPNKSP